jgi:serine/threonine protein kinase
MATVHFGALLGEAGFSRIVAIKTLHTGKQSRSMVSGLIDEARLVSRVRHPNVVPTLDVVTESGELLVVLEYVVGESLSRLLRANEEAELQVPLSFATTMIAGVLHGLNAAHDAKSARGKPLGIVHRDVSPQNIMVGVDGLARVLDFGIAKAAERLSQSVAGQVKGKLAYMSLEQLRGKADRRTDIYASGVVLWELLSGRRLFYGKSPGDLMEMKIAHEIPPPSSYRDEVPPALDAIVIKALQPKPDDRYETARQMALALEDVFGVARSSDIGAWVQELAGPALARRAGLAAAIERAAADETGDAPSIVTAAPPDSEFTENVVSSNQAVSMPTTQRAPRPLAGAATMREDSGSTELSNPPSEAAATVFADDTTTSAVQLHTMVSQTTPKSMAAPSAAAPESVTESRALWVIGAACAVIAVSVGALLMSGPDETSSRGEEHDTPPAVAAQVEPTVSEVPTVASAAPSAGATAVASATAAPAVASASAPKPITPAPFGTVPSKERVTPPAPPNTPSCDPPYTIDERGVRHLKPACM